MMIKKLVLKGLLLTAMFSTVGCSSFMWEGHAINKYQKHVRQSDHSFLQEYDTIYLSVDRGSYLEFIDQTGFNQRYPLHACKRFNASEISKKLIQQQLISAWPKCTSIKPDDMTGVLSIHLFQRINVFKDEIKITYRDEQKDELKDQVEGILMLGIKDFSDFLVGDISNRLLMANTPEKGTKAYKQWAKKVKSSCNCLYQ